MRQFRFFRNDTPRHAMVALAGLTLAAAPALYAQVDTGQITGTITDPSGAIVPNAQITARNVGTNQERSTKSEANGAFTFPSLPVANYEVTVTAPGFQSVTQSAELTVGGHVTLDTKLSVGSGAEKVTVTAASGGAEVNTSTQEISQIIGKEQVAQLPSLTRNPYDFIGIAGNVSNGDISQGHEQNSAQRGVSYGLNGQRSTGTDILLDGVENVNLFTAGIGQTVPINTVQEYRVITDNFPAQYGTASGGVVNVITKAGTNQFHGSVWEFNRLSAYTANTFDNAVNGARKGNYTRNQFGFDVGGPIKKDRLFFYEGTEWLRVRSSANQFAFVPDPAFIAASNAATQAYFAQYGQNVTGRVTNILTAGQLASQFKQTGTALANLPTNTPALDQVSYAAPTDAGGGAPGNQYYLNSRLDYNLSSATTTYVRYALWKYNYQNGYDFSSPYAQYNVGETTTNNSTLWNISHIFSQNLLTNTKLSFTRFNNAQTYDTSLQNTPTLYLSSGASIAGPNGTQPVQLPGFYDTNTGTGGLPYGGPENTVQWNQDVNWTKGAHQLQFGAEVLYIQVNQAYGAYAQANEQLATSPSAGLNQFLKGQQVLFQAAVNPQGQLPCSADYLSANRSPANLINPASCLINLPTSQPNFARSDRFHDNAGYAQDSWKATPKITLNYGVRYEYYGVQHNNKQNLDSNFYFGAGPGIVNQVRNGQVFTTPNSPIHGLYSPSYGTVSPRLGFAADLFGNGKSSLRGGWGISYERNFGNVTFNVIQNPPNYAVLQSRNVAVTTSDLGQFGGTGAPVPLPPVSLRNVDQNIRTAQTQFWSLALDQQIVPNTVVSFQYAGARGLHLYDIKNYNEVGAGNVYLGDSFAPTTDTATGAQTFHYSRPNSQYTSINNRGSNGDSYYHALNVQVQSTNLLHSGVNFVANYTWSHNIDDVSSTFSESNSSANGVGNLGYLNPYNPRLDRGNSDLDIRSRFTAAPIWNTPWFSGKSGWKGQALGNYIVSGIFTARTGTPFTFSDSNNSLNAPYEQGIVRYTPAAGGGTIRYHASSAQAQTGTNSFTLASLPAAMPFGNPAYGPSPDYNGLLAPGQAALVGIPDFGPYPATMTRRNVFYGPGAWNFDLAASKRFPIKEGVSAEFRAEGFDIFNHHNLYTVGNLNDVANYGYNAPSIVQGRKGGSGYYGGANDERRFGQFAVKVNF